MSSALSQKQFPKRVTIPCTSCGGSGDNKYDPRDVCDTCEGAGTRSVLADSPAAKAAKK